MFSKTWKICCIFLASSECDLFICYESQFEGSCLFYCHMKPKKLQPVRFDMISDNKQNKENTLCLDKMYKLKI